MSEHWYAIDAETARFFRIGECLERGAHLGLSPAGAKPVFVEERGQLVGIQYDIAQHELILVLNSAEQRRAHEPRRAAPVEAAGGGRRLTRSQRTRQTGALSYAGGSPR